MPHNDQTVAWCLRSTSWSWMSSCSREKLWISSIAAAAGAARAGSPSRASQAKHTEGGTQSLALGCRGSGGLAGRVHPSQVVPHQSGQRIAGGGGDGLRQLVFHNLPVAGEHSGQGWPRVGVVHRILTNVLTAVDAHNSQTRQMERCGRDCGNSVTCGINQSPNVRFPNDARGLRLPESSKGVGGCQAFGATNRGRLIFGVRGYVGGFIPQTP